MSGPHIDPAIGEILDDLWMARHGDPRFGHEDFRPFPSLIARADETGDLDLRVLTRLEGAYSALWAGRTTDVLTLVAWLYRTQDAHGVDFELDDWQVEQFQTTVVDLLDSLTGIPELSLEQSRGITDDWSRRVKGTVYYAPAVEAAVHADIAVHQGRSDEAVRILDGCVDYRPPAGTCGPGTRATVGAVYVAAGAYARAEALSTPDLDGDPAERCGFYPAETYGALIEAWGRAGRRDDVIRAARSLEETYGPVHLYGHIAHAMVALLRVDALADALPMALRHADVVDQCPNPLAAAQLAAALSATFASAADSDADTVVVRRDEDGVPSPTPASQVAAELADYVRVTAGRFDVRNASNAVSSALEEVLAVRATTALRTKADARVKPIANRTAAELVSGLSAFASSSPRRAEQCADALRPRVEELSGRTRVRARHMLAWDRRRTDPDAAVEELRAAADASRSDYPAWSAQSDLLAALLEVHSGGGSPELLVGWRDADPEWSAGARANFARLLGMALAPFDPTRALAAVDEGLGVLDRVDAGEIPLLDDPEALAATGSVDADAAASRSALHRLRVDVLGELARGSDGFDPSREVDAALVAARRAADLASDADQGLLYRSELVGALQLAAGVAARTDGAAALLLLGEAETVARYSLLAEVLASRSALRLDLDDIDVARDDAERALAVWMVEGDDGAADIARFDLGHIMLMREEDPLAVIELVESAVATMEARGDVGAQMQGMQVLARAQSAAGRSGDSVESYTRVIDAYTDHVPQVVQAQLHAARAVEHADQQQFPEALADLDAAVAWYSESGAGFDAADCLRTAALTAYFAGDHDGADAYLARADQAYEELATGAPVDFERARLDFARADIVRVSDPERSTALLRDVAARSRAANWIGLLVPVLHLSATIAADDGHTADALALVQEALRHAPDHPALLDLLSELEFPG
ncbi:MAG: hypothetical protein LBE07_01870 [Gordonia sp. (in: high G+C Gram-positive bacteria)]|jgi:tetratricopeptide (TPR) repeat protein|nr:hypothetical protein [Gordonia sp. (in: high G+C Gram-positive bacteria)]